MTVGFDVKEKSTNNASGSGSSGKRTGTRTRSKSKSRSSVKSSNKSSKSYGQSNKTKSSGSKRSGGGTSVGFRSSGDKSGDSKTHASSSRMTVAVVDKKKLEKEKEKVPHFIPKRVIAHNGERILRILDGICERIEVLSLLPNLMNRLAYGDPQLEKLLGPKCVDSLLLLLYIELTWINSQSTGALLSHHQKQRTKLIEQIKTRLLNKSSDPQPSILFSGLTVRLPMPRDDGAALKTQFRSCIRQISNLDDGQLDEIFNNITPEYSHPLKYFYGEIQILHRLMYTRLLFTPDEEFNRIYVLRNCWIKDQRHKRLLKGLKADLKESRGKRDDKMSELNIQVNSLFNQIDHIFLHTHQDITRIIAEAQKVETVTSKGFDHEMQSATTKLVKAVQVAGVMREKFKEFEKKYRDKRRKLEAELEDLVGRFDEEMIARQELLDQLSEDEKANFVQIENLEKDLRIVEKKKAEMDDEMRLEELSQKIKSRENTPKKRSKKKGTKGKSKKGKSKKGGKRGKKSKKMGKKGKSKSKKSKSTAKVSKSRKSVHKSKSQSRNPTASTSQNDTTVKSEMSSTSTTVQPSVSNVNEILSSTTTMSSKSGQTTRASVRKVGPGTGKSKSKSRKNLKSRSRKYKNKSMASKSRASKSKSRTLSKSKSKLPSGASSNVKVTMKKFKKRPKTRPSKSKTNSRVTEAKSGETLSKSDMGESSLMSRPSNQPSKHSRLKKKSKVGGGGSKSRGTKSHKKSKKVRRSEDEFSIMSVKPSLDDLDMSGGDVIDLSQPIEPDQASSVNDGSSVNNDDIEVQTIGSVGSGSDSIEDQGGSVMDKSASVVDASGKSTNAQASSVTVSVLGSKSKKKKKVKKSKSKKGLKKGKSSSSGKKKKSKKVGKKSKKSKSKTTAMTATEKSSTVSSVQDQE